VRAGTLTPSRANVLAILFALLFPSLLTLVYFLLLASATAATQFAAYGSLKFIQFGFPLFWVLFVQRRRIQFSWPGREGLVAGIAFGALVLLAMWTLYQQLLLPSGMMEVATGPVADKIAGFGANTMAAYLAMAIFYSLIHSFLEEYYWRWFVFAQLRDCVSIPVAILVSSLGFMAHHVILVGTFFGWGSPLAWGLAICVSVGGVIWAWMYQRWNSLYPIWFGHLLVDAGIFWVGYDLVGGF
jgi:membrane protease YdiL (CAAX protease family)